MDSVLCTGAHQQTARCLRLKFFSKMVSKTARKETMRYQILWRSNASFRLKKLSRKLKHLANCTTRIWWGISAWKTTQSCILQMVKKSSAFTLFTNLLPRDRCMTTCTTRKLSGKMCASFISNNCCLVSSTYTVKDTHTEIWSQQILCSIRISLWKFATLA